MNKKSFTAASTLPVKIISDKNIISDTSAHNIRPVHLQLNPTNKCPYSCSFCTCGKRDLSQSYDFEKFKKMLDTFSNLGTQAVTLTGGGDPLAYKYFSELLSYILEKDMEAALVTNGFMFPQYEHDTNIGKLTWCRISVYDEYPFIADKIERTIDTHFDVDWAFSFVVTEKYDFENLKKCITFANKYKDRFSHIRVVSDIINEKVGLDNIEKELSEEFDTSLCIFQGRKNFVHGTDRCMVSLLKPNIDPEGNFYPCCGVQYAIDDTIQDFDKRLSMGNVFTDDIEEIYRKQNYFNGSLCNKCYYNDYNVVLNELWDSKSLTHKKFI